MPMSPENRAKLAARNRATKVWELARDTGPKTPEGKAVTSQNALQHGARGKAIASLQGWLRSLRELAQSQKAPKV